MTEIRKIDVTRQLGSKTDAFQLARLAEAVNLLQGVTDPEQRAVRVFELEARLAEIESRLTAAGV